MRKACTLLSVNSTPLVTVSAALAKNWAPLMRVSFMICATDGAALTTSAAVKLALSTMRSSTCTRNTSAVNDAERPILATIPALTFSEVSSLSGGTSRAWTMALSLGNVPTSASTVDPSSDSTDSVSILL